MAKKTSARRSSASSGDELVIREQDVVLIQATPELGYSDLQDLVFGSFVGARELRRAGTQWLAFSGTGRLHFVGRSEWIGLSKSVPLDVMDFIQHRFEKAGCDVGREMGRSLHHGMLPFARLSDDGLEILVPAALVGPDRKRIVPRGGTEPIARGYVLRA
jgi:hypothetical protein